MDEMSWQARLARNNINILNIDDERWFYEFMYHPYPGSTKWCKTFYEVPSKVEVPEDNPIHWVTLESDPEEIAAGIVKEVAKLRRELER